jgi:Glycosyltransferase Family 4
MPSHTIDENNSPLIVWDGLGLCNEYSGVGTYGHSLYTALATRGIRPYVVVNSAEGSAYVTGERRLEIGSKGSSETPLMPQLIPRLIPQLIPAKLRAMKPIFSLCAYSRAKSEFPKSTSTDPRAMIYHGLSNINLPAVGRKRTGDKFVITVHDIIPLLAGENTALALQMKILLPRVLERADHIITVSSWTRQTLIEHFGNRLFRKITVIGNGTAPVDDVTAAMAASTQKTIDGLTIARGESYKRLEIVEAVARGHPHSKFAVVTCAQGRQRLVHAPENLKVHVQLTGQELQGLMASSKILIHPALFEGWCLPAADALSRGLHVMYCTGSGIDEVVANHPQRASGLTSKASLADWCDGFKAALSAYDPQLKAPVLENWSDVAKKTLNIYALLV